MCASLTACTMIRGQLGASINLIVCINFDKIIQPFTVAREVKSAACVRKISIECFHMTSSFLRIQKYTKDNSNQLPCWITRW